MRRFLLPLLLLLLYACSGKEPVSKEPAARIGEKAPGFTVRTVEGKTVTLADFKGRPLVLAFMAEWCPCSNDSVPVFKEAYGKYGRNVGFLVLGFQDSESKFKAFVNKHALPFPAAYDGGDRIGASFGVIAPPTTFFISREGKIEKAFYGKIAEKEKLFAFIDEVIEKR